MRQSEISKSLIAELRHDPRYRNMLDEISGMRRVPRYSPGKDSQSEKWVYESGMDAGIEKVLRYLGYE